MVTAYQLAAEVPDPELPVLTIDDLGILRGVRVRGSEGDQADVEVAITPTYSGCPAIDAIRSEIEDALHDGGFGRVTVVTRLAPPWTTDWISAEGRRKLTTYGIAPPGPSAGGAPGARPTPLTLTVRCPRCESPDTEELSRFGSTACKAIWRCRACAEPFEAVKAL